MLFGHRSRPVFVLLLSQRFKYGYFVFMQDSALCSAHRAKTTQDDLQNVLDFATDKTFAALQQSQNRMGTNSAHFQLNVFKTTDNFVCFFCILTCNITFLSISIKVRNINVYSCISVNECLLTDNMHLV